MSDKCPCAKNLVCSQAERMDEFYRQMSEAMLQNKPVYYLTGGQCPAFSSECMKLREFRARQLAQNQK